jgi:hypothetical protein
VTNIERDTEKKTGRERQTGIDTDRDSETERRDRDIIFF